MSLKKIRNRHWIGYERAMQQGRNDGWIYYNIANCCSDLKRYEEAIRYLEKGYEQEPSIEIGARLWHGIWDV